MLTLKIHDFKAIKEATLELADVTVVTGNNSTGKSTIAAALNAFVMGAADYPLHAAARVLYLRLMPKLDAFRNFVNDVLSGGTKRDVSGAITLGERNGFVVKDASGLSIFQMDWVREFWHRRPQSRDEFHAYLGEMRNQVASAAAYLGTFCPPGDRFLKQLAKSWEYAYDDTSTLTGDILTKMVDDSFGAAEFLYELILRERPCNTIADNLYAALPNQSVEVREDGEPLFPVWRKTRSQTFARIGVCASLKRAIYLRSPYADDISQEDGICYVGNAQVGRIDKAQSEYGRSETRLEDFWAFVGGQVAWDEQEKTWTFAEKGALKPYKLDECATGIRAIANFKKLEQLGLLDAQTVLIIDEPEAHLHPEWIVKYAALLIQAVKVYGIHLFVATHSPMMTLALHDIAAAEGLMKRFKCYTTEVAEGETKATLRDMGTEISASFDSFNRAYDLVADYEARQELPKNPFEGLK